MDGFTITLDDAALLAGLERLGATVERFTMPAALETAKAVQREARARVARRTGATAEGIVVREDYVKKGYIVTTGDVLAAGERTLEAGLKMGMRPGKAAKWASRGYTQQRHVGLYLEGGTKKGAPRSHTAAPRPFLAPAVDVNQAGHGRRMRAAVQAAIEAAGFGGD